MNYYYFIYLHNTHSSETNRRSRLLCVHVNTTTATQPKPRQVARTGKRKSCANVASVSNIKAELEAGQRAQ